MQKVKLARYNDGIVAIYRDKDRRNSFSAQQNVSVLDDMEFLYRLAFSEESKRQQDMEFASQNDFTLSLKIRTRFVPRVDNKCKAVINGYLYDIAYVDATKTDLWLYMQGVGEIA
jgi:SPP1 family predicted phage head-tail adaptor